MVNIVIRDALKAQGRGSQRRLAAAIDVSEPSVTKWVKGHDRPTEDKWPAIEHALDLEEGALVRAARADAIGIDPAAGIEENTAAIVNALSTLSAAEAAELLRGAFKVITVDEAADLLRSSAEGLQRLRDEGRIDDR